MGETPEDRLAGSTVARPRPAELARDRRRRRLQVLARAERTIPVSFALVGVQKAATSTLYRMLVQHPEVAGRPEKEMHFFDDDGVDWSDPDYRAYARPARSPQERLAGDATPTYFFWPRALERMRRYDPGMNLLLTVRDPVERAMSQWSMQRERDPSYPDLPDAIRRWASSELPEQVPEGSSPARYRTQSLFVRGLYGQQLTRGLSFFPASRWCVVNFSDVIHSSQRVLDRVTDHLGIARFDRPVEPMRLSATRTDHTGPAPTALDIERLVEVYAEDLTAFATTSGIDVSGWATARVLSGAMTVHELRDRVVSKLGLG